MVQESEAGGPKDAGRDKKRCSVGRTGLARWQRAEQMRRRHAGPVGQMAVEVVVVAIGFSIGDGGDGAQGYSTLPGPSPGGVQEKLALFACATLLSLQSPPGRHVARR
ncbi:hypothetical protein CDD82_6437 [Ophiocordyceps australis]|uniref:Uncharacterized protein n=1 Tax=Ophiocordyceps australis TaxID=1399860 RepID=A0A2C5YS28_9HYPO|nr:hypothetical protein CDD82_6437 [Ophiocordyceps australis]